MLQARAGQGKPEKGGGCPGGFLLKSTELGST